jgi:hypothetical protein
MEKQSSNVTASSSTILAQDLCPLKRALILTPDAPVTKPWEL